VSAADFIANNVTTLGIVHKKSVKAYSAWAVVCVVWGTTYLAIRIALETVPPFLMGGFRYTLAGIILIAALAWRGERLPRPREWGPLIVLGILLLGFGNGGVVWAEQYVASGLTAVLIGTSAFWMTGVSAAFPGGGALTRRHVAGLTVGFGGIVLLVWPELTVGDSRGTFAAGVVATQLACVGWAFGSAYARGHNPHGNVLTMAAFEMLFGGLALIAAGSLHREWTHLTFTPRSAVALGYLVVFGAVIAFSAYAYALKHLPVALVSTYAYVNPVIAVVLGTLVLGEPFTSRIAVAGAVVIAGMMLVRSAGADPG
jgi:drug/metabolite transporter (DMT)-like permease